MSKNPVENHLLTNAEKFLPFYLQLRFQRLKTNKKLREYICFLNNSYSFSHLNGHDLDGKEGEGRKLFYFNFPGQLSFSLYNVNAKKFKLFSRIHCTK